MPKKKKPVITVERLFWQLEGLRLILKVSIKDVAFMLEVTPLAYKNWKNHAAEIKANREPSLREAIANLDARLEALYPQS